MDEKIKEIKRRFMVIGTSQALIDALRRALKVAPVNLTVLVTGESGTGKEVMSQVIHAYSNRKGKKLISLNCGAIPPGTIDSALFGHEKGSFTDATREHHGYFEEANGGTVFLDEIAEMPMETQSRLLRVLQSGEFMRVGANTPRKTDVRVVAATNKDLRKLVAEGKFREDLYYRLSQVSILMPPLRDRGNDILLMAERFAMDFSDANGMPVIEFGEDAKRLLLNYEWPGNVRELMSVVKQVALFEAGRTVDAAQLRAYLPTNQLVVVGDGKTDYDTDRENIFKQIRTLRAEVEALKQLIRDLVQQPVGARQMALPQSTEAPAIHTAIDDLRREPTLSFIHHQSAYADNDSGMAHDLGPVEEVIGEEPEQSQTLTEMEREKIASTLRKNGNKRRLTAQQLGISERTLYRKIKQYGIN